MNKSKRLRSERQAYLTKRRELEIIFSIQKQKETSKFIQDFLAIGQEVDEEIKQEVVV